MIGEKQADLKEILLKKSFIYHPLPTTNMHINILDGD